MVPIFQVMLESNKLKIKIKHLNALATASSPLWVFKALAKLLLNNYYKQDETQM